MERQVTCIVNPDSVCLIKQSIITHLILTSLILFTPFFIISALPLKYTFRHRTFNYRLYIYYSHYPSDNTVTERAAKVGEVGTAGGLPHLPHARHRSGPFGSAGEGSHCRVPCGFPGSSGPQMH